MKKTLLFSILALLGMTQAVAQEYEYVPFVREGVKWTYSIQDYHYETDYETNPARGDNKVYRTLEIKGDTVINGKTYKAMHMCVDDEYSEPREVVPVYLREENKMVYGIVPDGMYYDDTKLGYYATKVYDEILSGEEFLLYDFQDPITYWENLTEGWYDIHLLEDTIMVGGRYVKRYYKGEQEEDFQIIDLKPGRLFVPIRLIASLQLLQVTENVPLEFEPVQARDGRGGPERNIPVPDFYGFLKHQPLPPAAAAVGAYTVPYQPW